MKRFILLLLVSYSIDLIAQNYTGKETVLPNYTTASPEAASLGQYGNVPINLSMGQINYTIPLYTIKVGDFEYPLTLSYGYSGFKPESDPSMVGMGWTANFGGAIVKQVKGSPDDDGGYHANGFYIDKIENLNNLPETEKVEWLKKIVDDGLDLRPDVYIINTPTLSGTYRVKLDGSCVFSEQCNYDITVGSDFDLKDDKGVLYQFATKETTSLLDLGTRLGRFPIDKTYISSWMISQIKTPNGKGNLNFTYTPYSFNTQQVSKTNYKREFLSGQESIVSSSSSGTQSQILNRIDFPGGYVTFGTNVENTAVSGNALGSNYNYRTNQVKLQYMSVYDSYDKLITKYVFDYYDQGYYYFLKSIVKEDGQGKQEDYYSFGYYDLNLVPSNKIISDQVDMWGFYNGRAFNENDIPYSLNSSYIYGRIGALKQITYPTKGTTEVEYEDHGIVKYSTYFKNLTPELDASVSLYDAVSEPDHADYTAVTKELVIPYRQQVEVTLEIFSTYSSSQHCGLQNSSGVTIDGISLGAVPGSGVQTSTFSADLDAGTYYLYSLLERAGENDSYSRVTVRYSSSSGGGSQSFTTDLGGIRVAETIDNPGNGQQPITRTYKYPVGIINGDSYLRFESLRIERDVHHWCDFHLGLNGDIITMPCYGECIDFESYTDYTESLRPILPLTSLGSHVIYNHVEIESNGGINGKTRKEFSDVVKTSVPDNPIFPDLISDFEHRKFELTNEAIYSEGKVEPIQGTLYNYQEVVDINQNNYIADYQIMRYPKDVTYINCDATKTLKESKVSSFQIGSIRHQTRAYRIESTNTWNKENNGTISTHTNYLYDPQTGYSVEVSTTNSDGKIIKNNTYYPKNSGQLSGLNQSVINTMIAQNMLANPIQTEKVVEAGGTLLSKTTQRTAFKDWGTNPDNTHRIFPEYIQTSIGANPLESRIRYHDYYPNGNGKEVSKTDDISIYYIWGYQEQYPIAMIENFTTAQANAVQSNLINPAVAASNSDNDRTIGADGKEGALRTALNSIRNNEALKNAMITTYTYDPLVGITSVTNPRGVTTYYNYDAVGRLSEIYRMVNGAKQSVQTYQYNFKP